MSQKESNLRFALRNLRHLYEQMLSGHVVDQVSAANGLLSPAIKMLEELESNPQQYENEIGECDNHVCANCGEHFY